MNFDFLLISVRSLNKIINSNNGWLNCGPRYYCNFPITLFARHYTYQRDITHNSIVTFINTIIRLLKYIFFCYTISLFTVIRINSYDESEEIWKWNREEKGVKVLWFYEFMNSRKLFKLKMLLKFIKQIHHHIESSQLSLIIFGLCSGIATGVFGILFHFPHRSEKLKQRRSWNVEELRKNQ